MEPMTPSTDGVDGAWEVQVAEHPEKYHITYQTRSKPIQGIKHVQWPAIQLHMPP